MKRDYHLVNIAGILLLGSFFAAYSNRGNGFNVAFHIGTMIGSIAPALIVLLIGLIIRIFKMPNWKRIYLIAWGLFLIVNFISIWGGHLIKLDMKK